MTRKHTFRRTWCGTCHQDKNAERSNDKHRRQQILWKKLNSQQQRSFLPNGTIREATICLHDSGSRIKNHYDAERSIPNCDEHQSHSRCSSAVCYSDVVGLYEIMVALLRKRFIFSITHRQPKLGQIRLYAQVLELNFDSTVLTLGLPPYATKSSGKQTNLPNGAAWFSLSRTAPVVLRQEPTQLNSSTAFGCWFCTLINEQVFASASSACTLEFRLKVESDLLSLVPNLEFTESF